MLSHCQNLYNFCNTVRLHWVKYQGRGVKHDMKKKIRGAYIDSVIWNRDVLLIYLLNF